MRNRLLATLLLFFGLLSTANAALSLVVGDGVSFLDQGDEITINIGDTVWIGVNDDVGVMHESWWKASVPPHIDWPVFEIIDTAVYSPPAISTATGWIQGGNGWWTLDLEEDLGEGNPGPLPGVGAAMEYRGIGYGYFQILLNPSMGGPITDIQDFLKVNVVPEPVSILLFGFGGLALLKNRKR